MRKKLFKAKKNWVIGVIAGLMLFAGGATTANADNQNATISDQAVPNTSLLRNQGEEMANKKNDAISDSIEDNGKVVPDYSESNDAEMQSSNIYQIYETSDMDKTTEPKLEKVTDDRIGYVFNGADNAVYFKKTSNISENEKKNQQAVEALSTTIARENKNFLENNENYTMYFDGDKLFHHDYGGLNNGETKHLKNRNLPVIRFDKTIQNGNNIISLYQSFYGFFDHEGDPHGNEAYACGYTFENGKQLSLTDVLRPESKYFSWKKDVTGYIIKQLQGRRDPYIEEIYVGQRGLPVWTGKYGRGPLSFVFSNDGVVVVINTISDGHNLVQVPLPMSFLKPEYQAFYGSTVAHPKVEIGEVDLEQSDLEYLKSNTLGLGNLYNDITKTIDGYNQVMRLARFDDVRGESPKPSAKNSKVAHGIALATDMVKLNTSVDLTDFGNNMLHVASDVFSIINDNVKEIEKSVENGIKSGDLKLGKVEDALSVGADITDTYNNFNKMQSSNEKEKLKGTVSKRKTNFESSRSAHISLMSSISKFALDGFKSNPVLSTFIAAGGAAVIGLLIWKLTNLFSFVLPQDWSDNNLLKRFRLRKKSK